jgi:hypothetical protein
MFKKLLLVFAILFMVVLVSGCGEKEEIEIPKLEDKRQVIQENQEIKLEEKLEAIKEKEAHPQAVLMIASQEAFMCLQKGGEILAPKDSFEGGGEICSVELKLEGEISTWRPANEVDSKNFNGERYSYGIVNNDILSIVQGDSTVVCCRIDMGVCGDANICELGTGK